MFIAGISFGMSLLAVSYLMSHWRGNTVQILQITIIGLLGWLSSGYWWLSFPDLRAQLFVAMLPLTFMLLISALHWYQMALTSTYNKIVMWQWLPVGISALLSLSMLIMPTEAFSQVFLDGLTPATAWAKLNAIAFGITLVAWVVLSLFYAIKSTLQIIRYHKSLSNLFSNHSHKRLYWYLFTLAWIGITWCYSVFVLALEDKYAAFGISENGVNWMLLITVWLFCTYSLQHVPAVSSEPAEEQVKTNAVYERSAINHEHMSRIAKKIETVVIRDRAFEDPNFTAMNLAEQTGASTHYLSQTFSQLLATTFYDYINTARVEYAKTLLKNTDKTVLSIANDAGFQSRSSFYTAFKKHSGMTPSAFRAAPEKTEL